ncbi:YdcF family protein [Nocardia flavorosea]|uniref:YdcF family protein n=1 Tax=Nocardia flavorosea TaxID=53429 RepID=A0A846Y982_9NOCA|nr:YdcF family protein [Nocardia flavorosea]NKY55025.1 YdcF family protein [Nocardia flavorosea]
MSDTHRGRHRRRRHRSLRAALTTALTAAAISAGLCAPVAAVPTLPGGLPAGIGDLPTGPLPRVHGPGTAIVILGYGLLPDGTMRPELVNRLRAGYIQALLAPHSPVIVTGGNPRNGVTEAAAMAEWLVGHGLPAHRVHQEPAAATTVQNARRSAQLIRALGVHDAVVVTSEDHIDRAADSFTAAGVSVAATLTPRQIPGFVAVWGP